MFRTLCLSGGGCAGLVHVGYVTALQEEGLLQEVDTVVGCSIGAIVGCMWILGLECTDMVSVVETITDQNIVSMRNAWYLFTKLGLDDGTYFVACLVDMLMDVGMDPHMTLGDLHRRTGKRLITTVVQTNTKEVMYFGPESHPDLPVTSALRASACLPFVFVPFELDGRLYADGGIRENYPILRALHDAEARSIPASAVLGCSIRCVGEGSSHEIRTFERYFSCVMACFCSETSLHPSVKACTQVVDVPLDNPPIGVTLTSAQRASLIVLGAEAAERVPRPETQASDWEIPTPLEVSDAQEPQSCTP